MSLKSYKMRGFVEFLRLYRSKSTSSNDSNVVVAAAARQGLGNNGFGNMQLAGVRLVHAVNKAAASSSTGGIGANGKPIGPPSLKPPSLRPTPRGRIPMWMIGGDYFRRAKLTLGAVITVLLSFWAPKWATLLNIGGEAEIVVKEAEQAAEIVEKVAAEVEKVSEELANDLPDGNKFKEAALIVEHVSEEAAKDALIAEQILHKVDVVEQDLKDVGEIVEPIINNIKHDEKSIKPVN